MSKAALALDFSKSKTAGCVNKSWSKGVADAPANRSEPIQVRFSGCAGNRCAVTDARPLEISFDAENEIVSEPKSTLPIVADLPAAEAAFRLKIAATQSVR